MSADDFRYLTIIVTLVSCMLMPYAIYRRVKHPAVVLIALVLTIQYVGAVIATTTTIGEGPLVWYATPRIFLADVVSLVYVGYSLSVPENDPR